MSKERGVQDRGSFRGRWLSHAVVCVPRGKGGRERAETGTNKGLRQLLLRAPFSTLRLGQDLTIKNVASLGDTLTWRTFRIFFIFFCSGESEAAGRGGGWGRFFIENPRRGGGFSRRGRGAGRVSAANWGILRGGCGGAKYFFFQGRNVHQANLAPLQSETPECGSRRMGDLGTQGGSAKALARNNALGGSTARATGAWQILRSMPS